MASWFYIDQPISPSRLSRLKPKWCELFLISLYSTKLKVNETSAVTGHYYSIELAKLSAPCYSKLGLLQFVYTKNDQICVRYTIRNVLYT